MFDINTLNVLIRIIFINICVSYVFIKNSNNMKLNYYEYIGLIINIIVVSIIFILLRENIDIISRFFISYTLYILIIKLISKRSFSDIIFLTIISVAISLMSFVFSSAIYYFILTRIPFLSVNTENIVPNIIIGIVQSILVYSLFKINIFKCGFSFLKETSKTKETSFIMGSIIGIIALAILIMYGIIDNTIVRIYFTAILLILSVIFYKWIRKQMKRYLKNDTLYEMINFLEKEIKSKDEKLAIAKKIKHNYSNRIAAMELAVESANELTPDFKKAVKTLATDFRKDNMPSINITNLPITGILGVDSAFTYMLSEAEKDKIEFNLTLNDSLCISYMVKNTISEGELITIINNHIRNSIIAINSNKKNSKRILCILGLMDNCYGFSVSDTGIAFEIDTLLCLGLKEVTTHENKGGNGIGLMTAFEIARKYNASIIIEENTPSEIGYTKTISVLFDNKNEYKIRSYRADELQSKNKDNRIIIEKL